MDLPYRDVHGLVCQPHYVLLLRRNYQDCSLFHDPVSTSTRQYCSLSGSPSGVGNLICFTMVPGARLELARLSTLASKTIVYTNSTTQAILLYYSVNSIAN